MIEIKHLSKSFETAGGTVEALKDINLTIEDGDIYGIIGMSGAGKSTLVRCINMLERPTEGSVVINGKEMGSLSAHELREARRDITMIFQGFNLLMQRNCLRNICFPLELAGMKKADARKKAMELLKLVGLPDKAKNYPAQLSGGQQQRIAIARALATNPKVLLCDEATSALDNESEFAVAKSLGELSEGRTTLTIAHRLSSIRNSDRILVLTDDGIVEEGNHDQLMEQKGIYYQFYETANALK